MLFSAIIFSAEDVRGALLSRALEKDGFEVSLHKNVLAAENILKSKAPQLVIIDKEGYFPGELESLSLLSGLLKEIPVVIVSNSAADNTFSLKDVSVEWCHSNPLDPLTIASKAKSMLTVSGRNELLEKEKIAKDLMGFLGIK
jgi:DNA-binding NtrC family response regulator